MQNTKHLEGKPSAEVEFLSKKKFVEKFGDWDPKIKLWVVNMKSARLWLGSLKERIL